MGKVFSLDLHVHTPASHDYKGEQGDAGYLKILEQAKAKDVNLIAITDHNTILGYEELLRIRASLLTKREVFADIAKNLVDSNQIESMRVINEYNLSLYDSVKILPGVEFTLNPGVHIIAIFNESDLPAIKELISKIGCGVPYGIPNIDVVGFLKMEEIAGKIIIAPHIDSNNGIFNMEGNYYRAQVFKSERILAFSCNCPKQELNVRRTLNQQEYKRNAHTVFINASDAHTQTDVGSKTSFFNLSELTYEEILLSFSTPQQSISDLRNQNARHVVDNVLSDNKYIKLMDLTDLRKCICACLNSKYCHLVVGCDDMNIFKGIKESPEDFEAMVGTAISGLAVNASSYKIKRFSEQLGNTRYIHIYTFVYDSNSICYLTENNLVYFINSKRKIYQPSVKEMEEKIRLSLVEEYSEFEKNYNSELEDISAKLGLLASPVRKNYAFSKIYSNYIEIDKVVKIEIAKPEDCITKGEKPKQLNGFACGMVVDIKNQSARQKDAYLRFSATLRNDIETEGAKKFSGELIIVTMQGACYYVNQDTFYIKTDAPVIILRPISSDVSLLSLILWMKSSLFIWSMIWNNGDPSAYLSLIMRKMNIPTIYNKKEYEIIAKEIVEKEFKFLESELLPVIENMTDEYKRKMSIQVDEFNSSIEKILSAVDKKYAMDFDIPEKYIFLMQKDISSFDMHIFGLAEKCDEQLLDS